MDSLVLQFALADRIAAAYGGHPESAWLAAGDLIDAEAFTESRARSLFIGIHDEEAAAAHKRHESEMIRR